MPGQQVDFARTIHAAGSERCEAARIEQAGYALALGLASSAVAPAARAAVFLHQQRPRVPLADLVACAPVAVRDGPRRVGYRGRAAMGAHSSAAGKRAAARYSLSHSSKFGGPATSR